MKLIKNNLFTILGLAIVCLFATTGISFAQNTVEDIAIDKATDVFKSARNIMFVVGGFGLIATAFLGITGKMKWTWVGQIAIGLGILAAAGAIIEYVVGEGNLKKGSSGWEDTIR